MLYINNIRYNYITLIFSKEGFLALPTGTLSASVFFINTALKNDLSTGVLEWHLVVGRIRYRQFIRLWLWRFRSCRLLGAWY